MSSQACSATSRARWSPATARASPIISPKTRRKFNDGKERESVVNYQHILYEVADNVRVIVLTGAGRAFCAGADMEGLKGIDPNEIRRGENTPFDMNRRADWQTRYAYYPAIPKPVIGMLNGATAGIGLVHALDCDLRFAADALDLLMSARRVSSEAALRIGLVNRLYPPDQLREQTYAYARDLADFVSPSAISVIKRQLYDVPFQTLAEATIDANREMQIALKGSDFREGVASFMEKRPPRFTGK